MPDFQPLVMLVEDEPFVALAVGDMVRDMGLSLVGPFRTNAEAVSFLEHHCPTIAVLDYGLGHSTVSQTAQALCANEVPFLVMSGYSKSATIDGPEFAGVEWITKPFSEVQLYTALSNCLLTARVLHEGSRSQA